MENLSKLKCKACEGLEDKLSPKQIQEYISKLSGWYENKNTIRKEFKLQDFKAALELVNKVSQLAEEEGHHPDIEFGWGYVNITLSTHAVKGLSVNDFILAAKIDNLK